MLENIKFRTKLLAGYGIVLFLIVVIALVVFTSVKSLIHNFSWVEHTHDVLDEVSQIEAVAVDMETGMRGYLLAGNPDFLEPYKKGSERFNERIEHLQNEVSDNPAQVQLLQEISQTIGQWKSKVTEPTIALRAEIGDAKTMNDMAAVIKQAKGKHYFDKFRGQLATFIERDTTIKKTQRRGKK